MVGTDQLDEKYSKCVFFCSSCLTFIYYKQFESFWAWSAFLDKSKIIQAVIWSKLWWTPVNGSHSCPFGSRGATCHALCVGDLKPLQPIRCGICSIENHGDLERSQISCKEGTWKEAQGRTIIRRMYCRGCWIHCRKNGCCSWRCRE